MNETQTQTTELAGSARLPQLDLLRCVAILLVLGSHPPAKWPAGSDVPWLLWAWKCLGWTGVDLFFVLSGFLVSGLVFAEFRQSSTIDIPRFLTRRAFKIWPMYYVYLLTMSVVVLRTGEPLAGLLPFFVHLQNYLPGPSIGGHMWSLAVEEHFYLALPLVLAWSLPRLNIRAMSFVTAGIVIGAAAWRAIDVAPSPSILTHHRVDSLTLGVAIAFVYHFRHAWFVRWTRHGGASFAVGSLLVCLAGLPNPVVAWLSAAAQSALIPLALAVGYGLLLIATLSIRVDGGWGRRIFSSRVIRGLTFVGLYSYPIYIWHMIAYGFVEALVEHGPMPSFSFSFTAQWIIGMSVYVAVAIAWGVLMGRCIETPSLLLRDRWFPRRATPVLLTSPALSR